MKNISDIKLGGLYHIPHYMAMYDMVDPKQPDATLSTNKLLSPDLKAFTGVDLNIPNCDCHGVKRDLIVNVPTCLTC